MELIRSKPNRTYAGKAQKAEEAEKLKNFNPSDYPKYQELDFTGITDLKTGGTKLALYTQLNDATKVTPILGTHLVYDSLALKDEFFTCEKSGTSYVLKSPSFTITITNAGVVSCEKVKEAKEYVLCKVTGTGEAFNEDSSDSIYFGIMFTILREKASTYTYSNTQLQQRLVLSAEACYRDFVGDESTYMQPLVARYDENHGSIAITGGNDEYYVEVNAITIRVTELA